MDDTTIRISRAQNGFIVQVDDPDIKEDNMGDLTKGGKSVPWKDPTVKFTFTTAKDAAEFITTNISKMFPNEDASAFSKSFDMAAKDAK